MLVLGKSKNTNIKQTIPVDRFLNWNIPTEVVGTVTKEEIRNIAEVNTKEILRCNTKFDVKHELHLLTAAVDLFLREARADLEVKVYDNQSQCLIRTSIIFDIVLRFKYDWNRLKIKLN